MNIVPSYPRVDCRHFQGDRPCRPHKTEGVFCDDCSFYEPGSPRILVVKLAADGDVLRTTCLLPSLKAAYPQAHITWITEKRAEALLANHPLIDRLWAPPERFLPHLSGETFDLVINTDADTTSCHLARSARSERKIGFVSGERGEPIPRNTAASEWLQMGLWDPLKKANTRTYPAVIHEICEIPDLGARPSISLTEREIEEARAHLARKGLSPRSERPIIGINTGAGTRWPEKSLPLSTLEEVVAKLVDSPAPGGILLLGGPTERDRHRHLGGRFADKIIDTGNDNPVRHFASLISQVDLLLTADTLAMHIGLALEKYVIVHFGPTSATEIELYDFGEKLVPETDHGGSCYCTACPKTPKCNERIAPEEIQGAISRGIERLKAAAPLG